MKLDQLSARIGRINDYEAGRLSNQEILDFYQDLLDTGLCWALGGVYRTIARSLLQAGLLKVSSIL